MSRYKLYEVSYCPGGEYAVGASFYMDDIKETLKLGHFVPGMIFECEGDEFLVCQNKEEQWLERMEDVEED